MKGWTTMKRLKQVICGLMACLMLADPVSMCSTAYADENAPAEPEAILQMAPVEQEGTSLLQEAEQQEASGPEQEATGTADTSAPELDVSSLHIEYDAELGGRATLTYRVTDESEIADASCYIEVCANGLRTGNYIDYCGGNVNADGVVTETFRLNFYGKYEIVSISVRDVWGNAAAYYNSAYSEYKGQLPAADLSIATISLSAPTEDNDPPVIDIDSIRLEKAAIANGEDNAMQLSVADAIGVAELYAQFRDIENGKTADAITATALGEGIFSLQLHRPFPGKWQLFYIEAIDVCGNTVRLINAKHPYYSETFGTENLCDLSAIVFEVEAGSFATPVIDLASLSIDKNISRNREAVEISVNVENPASVRQLYITYIVPTDGGDGALVNDGPKLEYYTSGQFKGRFYPSYFGRYEVEWIELLDYNGEWQTIYNSALSRGWTLPENAVMYDLSGLNFDSVDAQIYTMEGLKAALAEVQDGERLQIAASEDFVIDEDITIPKGVYLNIQSGSGSFKIAEGVTFRTGSQFRCYVPMKVEGTWSNYSADVYVENLTISSGGLAENNENLGASSFRVEGSLKNNKQAQIRSYENFELTSTGSLDNSGEIYLDGRFVLEGKVTEHPGSHIYYTYKAKTLDELKELLKRAKAGDTITVDPGDSAFVISENVSVPEGVWLDLSGKNLVINTGVTFTIAGIGNVRNVAVNGTWENRGSAYCQEEVYVTDTGVIRHSKGYLFCCWGGLRIAEGGLVENNGLLHIEEKYENRGALTNNAGATARLTLEVRSAVELNAALACENPGQKEIGFGVSDAVTLTEDTVIPENTRLFVYDSSGNGKATLTVGEGVTLITRWSGYPCFECRVPLAVAGKLVNETGGIKLTKGLTITSTGCVDSTDGSIELTGAFVNAGVLVKGSYIRQTLIVRSMDELKSAMQGVAPSGTVEILGNSDFIISEDITIPKGITVEVYEDIQNLRLAAGAKLTVDTGATLRSYTPVEVDGTVYNYGSIGARRGMTVNGTIHNYDYIRVEGGEFVGTEKVTSYVTGVCSVRKKYTVDSEKSLHTTLNGLDLNAWNSLTVPEGFMLTKDVTIPAGVYLNVQSGTFIVGRASTLRTHNNLEVGGDMRIDGRWENNSSPWAGSMVYGKLDVSGSVQNSGHIELYQYTEALAQGKIQNSAEGTMSIGTKVSNLEELRKIAESQNCPFISIYWQGESELILDRDLTFSRGMRFYALDTDVHIYVPVGVTLSVAEGAAISGDNISIAVSGTLKNDGTCRFDEIEIAGQFENMGGFSFANMLITSTGKVEDAGVMIGAVDNQGEMRIVKRMGGSKTFCVGLKSTCDWKDVFKNVQTGDSVEFTYIRDDAYITVSEDVTLPERVSIGGGCFSIKEGATLTTNGALSAFTMDVKGKWVNNGPSEVRLLTVDGAVQNNASITVDRAYGTQNVTGKPVIIRSEADDITSPIRATILDLQDVLDSAPKGATIICGDYHDYYGETPSSIIHEDITIPEGVTVKMAETATLYLTPDHTLTVNGTLIAAQPLCIEGTLKINGELSIPPVSEADPDYLSTIGVTRGGIRTVGSGSCEINGSIRVGKTDYSGQPITDPFSVLEGVDTTTLTQRTVDGCWYLTKKTAEGRADIFCELPTTGYSLRLVGADGSMKELAPAGKGAAITNIAPGQYTLEVSKPGYVTHSISVDTAAIADTFAVELVMVGDVNGCAAEKGDVDITDMACLYTLLSTGSYDGQIKDEEYMKRVADVNGDGMINILDYQRLYMALNGAKA